jgi:hypothetical protein
MKIILAPTNMRNALLLCFIWLAIALPAQGMSIAPLTLDEIVAHAKIAFQGTCTANLTERDAQTGLVVTYSTFDVHDVLKGSAAATHTIKQVGGQTDTDNYRVEGVPSFAVGQDYVVFLYDVSSAGFSSPVGLFQGQFIVRQGPNGPDVSNGRDFKEMLQGHSPRGASQASVVQIQQAPGKVKHLGLDEFKQLVRQPDANQQ